MAFFARGRTFILGSLSLFALLAACGSDGAPAAPASTPPPDAGPLDDASSGDGGDAASTDVVVRWTSRYGFANGNITEIPAQPSDFRSVSAAAIVTVDGKKKIFPGTARPDGTVVIPGVPAGPYILESRVGFAAFPENDPPVVTQYPIDGARSVRLGPDFWARNGATRITSTTKLALSVEAPAAFAENDTFSWIGLRSYFYMVATYAPADPGPPEGQANVPAPNATSSTNWTLDADVLATPYGPEATGLPSAAAGDDLTLIQHRSSTVTRPRDRFDPWSSFQHSRAVGLLHEPSPTFTNETTNAVTGALSTPAKETVNVDFRGTSFAAVRDVAKYPKTTRASASVRNVYEAGHGPGYFASVAPESWAVVATSKPKPVVVECFPEELGTRCSQAACPVQCADASDGFLDPGDFTDTFEAPRLYTSDVRELYTFIYRYTLPWTAPNGLATTLTASVTGTRRKSGTTETFALDLGPVRNLRVNGMEMPWNGGELPSGTEVTVSFDPPAFGEPEHYEVRVIELLPDAGADGGGPSRPSRDAGRLFTRGTSVEIPDGLLRAGHYYYVRVAAERNGTDFTSPYHPKSDAQLSTAVFSAPFHIP